MKDRNRKDKIILLTMYLFAIEEVKRLHTQSEIREFLWANGMNYGVCNLICDIEMREKKTIVRKWIQKYVKKDRYWGKCPGDYYYEQNYKDLVLRALKLRARILKLELVDCK